MSAGKVVAYGHVVIQVQDLQRSIAFYRDVVGLKQVVAGDYFNAFEVGDLHFCVVPGGPHDVGVSFTTDDVRACRARVLEAGIDCSEIEENAQAGHFYITFRDPDGQEITIYDAHPPNMPAVSPRG